MKKLFLYSVLIIILSLSTIFPKYNQAYAYDMTNNEMVVDVGKNHFIVLKEDGSVWGWGDHTFGQLGVKGVLNSPPIPIQKADGNRLLNIKAIATGGDHTIALDNDGILWAWGRNNSGQLGYTTSSLNNDSPSKVTGIPTKIKAIAAGNYHSLAVDEDGYVWAWGRNNYGQIATSGANSTTPIKVVGLSNIVAVSAGAEHSVALDRSGTVYAWGRNSYGQLGNGQTISVNATPSIVSGLDKIVKIAAGSNHTLALKQDNTGVYAWGSNANGQLGDGGRQDRLTPILVSNISKVKMIAAGDNHSIAVKDDGHVWTWGENTSGSSSYRTTPIEILGLTNAIAIGGGGDSDSFTIAVKDDGTVWQWDKNSSDPTTKLPIFKRVAGIDDVMKKSEFPFVQGSQVLFRYIGNSLTSSVEIYGSFNDWQSIPLTKLSSNIWELQVKLKPGQYIYGFKVDGDWSVDPLNPDKTIEMNDGSPYSVLKVAPYAVEGPVISNKEVTFTYSSYDYSGLLELNAKTTYVAIEGDFTGWREVPLTKQSNNVWTLQQTIDPGEHAYSFIVSDAQTGLKKEVRNDRLNPNLVTNAVTKIPRNVFYVSEDSLSKIPVTGVMITRGTTLDLVVGETTTVTATVLPADATNKNVLWSSTNPSVASVSPTGGITAHTAGDATIIVSTVDGGKTAFVNVKVEKRSDAISYPRAGYDTKVDRPDIAPNKTWYINFSDALDSSSINGNTVYVLNESGVKMPLGYQLTNDDKTLEIRLQTGFLYEKGANYYLFIEKAVKSKLGGNELEKPVQMKFTIII